jgi:hypothetical protein
MKANLFILSLCLAIVQFSIASAQPLVDFSSPENTLKTYFENYGDRDVLSKCFYPIGFEGSLENWWIEYSIIRSTNTDRAGTTSYSGLAIEKDAVELIVEVKMRHPAKKNPKTKFWYLVQKVDGEWKIIEHSHIPDTNYPAYD